MGHLSVVLETPSAPSAGTGIGTPPSFSSKLEPDSGSSSSCPSAAAGATCICSSSSWVWWDCSVETGSSVRVVASFSTELLTESGSELFRGRERDGKKMVTHYGNVNSKKSLTVIIKKCLSTLAGIISNPYSAGAKFFLPQPKMPDQEVLHLPSFHSLLLRSRPGLGSASWQLPPEPQAAVGSAAAVGAAAAAGAAAPPRSQGSWARSQKGRT